MEVRLCLSLHSLQGLLVSEMHQVWQTYCCSLIWDRSGIYGGYTISNLENLANKKCLCITIRQFSRHVITLINEWDTQCFGEAQICVFVPMKSLEYLSSPIQVLDNISDMFPFALLLSEDFSIQPTLIHVLFLCFFHIFHHLSLSFLILLIIGQFLFFFTLFGSVFLPCFESYNWMIDHS